MRYVKSNLNILKTNNKINLSIKPSKSNSNLKKSTSTLYIFDPNLNIKGISNNLLTSKAYKNSIIHTKFYNNYKGMNNHSLKGKYKANKNSYSSQEILNNNSNNDNRGINIRLNFKNKIINNYFMKRYKINNSKNNIKNKSKNINHNINKRIKEKDKQITLLQKDLLQSQKLLNQLQKEKQKEISSKYRTIKYEDNQINDNGISSNSHGGIIKYSSLSDFFARDSEKKLKINILNTVYRRKKLSSKKSKSNSKRNIFGSRSINKNNKIKKNLNIIISTSSLMKFHLFNNTSPSTKKNCKTRNKKHKNSKKENFHYGAISKTNRKNKSFSSTRFKRCSSSSPNKLLTQFIHQYDCKSKTIKNSLKKKGNSNNFKKIYNSNKDSPYSAQNSINYKNIKNKSNSNNYDNVCSKSEELIDMMNKGEDLIERTKNLLSYLIILSDKIKELKEKKVIKSDI